MTEAALAALTLAIQEAPQIVAWINTAQAANDLTDDQLQQLLNSEHAAVAKFAADVQAAKNA